MSILKFILAFFLIYYLILFIRSYRNKILEDMIYFQTLAIINSIALISIN